MIIRRIWLTCLVILGLGLYLSVNAHADEVPDSCMFVTETSTTECNPRDSILVEWLSQSYDVIFVPTDSITAVLNDSVLLEALDFAVISQTVDAARTVALRGAPVPIFTTNVELSAWDISGWTPNDNLTGIFYGNLGAGVDTVKMIRRKHFMENEPSKKVFLIENPDTTKNYLTYIVPLVSHLPIAVSLDNANQEMCFGIERNTVLYRTQNVKDGTLISQSRCVAIGLDSIAFTCLTDEAWELMNWCVNWILGPLTDVAEDDPYVPETLVLNQNYPNPFNPTTTITFTIAEDNFTNLTVYNALGQVVAQLVNESLITGWHTITFDASALPSGLYFYKVQSGKNIQVRKMMVMK
jgi:hypothetical protein